MRSGKIVTAAGVSAGLDAALWLMSEIAGKERAEIVQLAIEYDPQPPYHSGYPTKATKLVFEITKREMTSNAGNIRHVVSIPKVLWHTTLDRIRRKKGG